MALQMIVNTRPRIVILGGGFAGAYCAAELQKLFKRGDADILVLDKNNYFIFYPLLVEAGTGSLEPRHAIVPIRDFLTRRTRFRMGEVLGVDAVKQQVNYCMVGEDEVRCTQYDHLIIATGSVTNFPPVPGLKEHAFQVKTLADSIALRDRAVQMLELANVARDENRKRALLHFVVVGANYTGTEVAGEFNEFLRSGTRKYRNLKPEDCKVTLVEMLPRILPATDEGLAGYALRVLSKRSIDVRLRETVKEIHDDHLLLKSGERLNSHTVVWTAGIAQNPVAKKLPFPVNERGYFECEPDTRIKGYNNVWAIGDTASNPNKEGKMYPPTAQAATRLGKLCARNVARSLEGKEPKAAEFKSLGVLSALGCRTAVADVFGVKVSGFAAWWLWRTVYLMKMPKFGRKVRVALDWTVDMFFKKDYSQLGIHGRNMSSLPADVRPHLEDHHDRETA